MQKFDDMKIRASRFYFVIMQVCYYMVAFGNLFLLRMNWDLTKKATAFRELTSLDHQVYDACEADRLTSETVEEETRRRQEFLYFLESGEEQTMSV